MPHPALIFDGPAEAPLTLALAHGAGAAMDTPFMSHFAQGLAKGGLAGGLAKGGLAKEGLGAAGYRVARFEFPYMAARRMGGSKRPPDREPVLLQSWRAVVEALAPARLVIGGKSMGGRMASLIADEMQVAGLVCLGYPFHPPGKPARLRTAHLESLRTPTLIVQGTRDPFGTRDEITGYPLSPAIGLHWCPDGDHNLAPRKASGRTVEQNWDEAVAAIAAFLRRL